MERPLHLCEVLEEEDRSLYGIEWHFTASDIIDANRLAADAERAFTNFAEVLPVLAKATAARARVDLQHEREEIAAQLNLLVDSPRPISEVHPTLMSMHPVAMTHALRDCGADVCARNRTILEIAFSESLRSARDFGWRYDRDQIRTTTGFASRWRDVIGEPPAIISQTAADDELLRDNIASALNDLVAGKLLDTNLIRRAVTAGTRKLLDDARDDHPRAADRACLNRQVLDDLFESNVQRGEDARLAKFHEVVHHRKSEHQQSSTALCFSGGGIRSATFGLGVLQGLARRNLLDKFDYISTVSGGGYIGGWLSSWIRRHPHGARGVAEELSAQPHDKLSPDPEPVRHLREFSNYLTPRLGAFSGDTLAVAAIYIRNLILNWFVLLPLIAAAVAVPRIVDAVCFSDLVLPTETLHRASRWLTENWIALGADKPWTNPMRWIAAAGIFDLTAFWTIESHTAAWVATVCLLVAAVYLGVRRPNGTSDHRTTAAAQSEYFAFCLIPIIIASLAIAAAWSQQTVTLSMFGAFVLLPLVAGCVYFRRYLKTPVTERGNFFARMRSIEDLRSAGLGFFARKAKILWEMAGVAAAAAATLLTTRWLASHVFANPKVPPGIDTWPSPILSMLEKPPVSALYVCFAVPAVLFVLFLSASLFIGVTSSVNEDYEREWWARSSGYLVGAIVIWIVGCGTVIFGPVLICFAPKIVASVGGVSGLVSVLIARSSKTPAKGHGGSLTTKIAASIAAPLFVLFVLAAASLLTSRILASRDIVREDAATLMAQTQWTSRQTQKVEGTGRVRTPLTAADFAAAAVTAPQQRPWPLSQVAPLEVTTSTEKRPMFDQARYSAWLHMVTFHESPFMPLAGFALACCIVAAIAARRVNVNQFSMHSMYRNRLIRAYLGASRRTRSPDPITGFDSKDNVAMHTLRPELLWATSFRDFGRFVERLRNPAPEDQLSALLAKELRRLSDNPDRLFATDAATSDTSESTRRGELFQLLNWILVNCDIDHLGARHREASFMTTLRRRLSDIQQIFSDPPPPADGTASQVRREPRPTPRSAQEQLRHNRCVLDRHYSQEIYPYDGPALRRTDIRKLRTFVQHFGRVEEVLRPAAPPEPSPEKIVPSDEPLPFELSGERISIRREINAPPDGASFDDKLLYALTPEARDALSRCRAENPHLQRELDVVVGDLNRILASYDLETVTPSKNASLHENRRILDRHFADAIHPLSTPRPMHVVNVALNLVGGENLAWQERKAESFTFSPLHAGSFRLGYRDSSRYGDKGGFSLGTAVTISGAAVSPNMGYHSSPGLAFLMTLFNVRLGWWLGNPGPHGGAETWTHNSPKSALRPLLAEATGNTNDTFEYVYLSDGGHFENLGLYEMVLRRRHFIVVSDAACDPDFSFDDLGNAIRKIRLDLGVPIDFDKMCVYPRSQDAIGRYCAMATIRYSAVDPNGVDGELLYIKPTIYMHEPKDVFNYATSSPAFPHETTGDQWFSESQFESYRMLGSYAVDQIALGRYGVRSDTDRAIAANWTPATMDEFFDRARDYLVKAKEERRAYRAAEARG